MLAERDAPEIASTFRLKPQSLFLRYFSEQAKGQRTALVVFLGTTFAGYVTVKWQSDYLPFREGGIPEINDLNVLPQFRRRGIATALVARAEALIADRCPVAGIGVGIDADYGAAQRMYFSRGYKPDGKGLTWKGISVRYGDRVTIDQT